MAKSRTFSIIKPDATRRNLTGQVNAVIESAGLRVVAQKRIRLSEAQAKKFYEVHKDRPFYGELVSQMTAEPVVVQVLEGEDAVAAYRKVMGATNPKEAADGTIRKLFALSIGENSVHGSDSLENAGIEIAQFFTDADSRGVRHGRLSPGKPAPRTDLCAERREHKRAAGTSRTANPIQARLSDISLRLTGRLFHVYGREKPSSSPAPLRASAKSPPSAWRSRAGASSSPPAMKSVGWPPWKNSGAPTPPPNM